ncbi:type II secretion system protein GspJ [Spirochaetota bacterium]
MKNIISSTKKIVSRSDGFSLMEILIATAIASMIILMASTAYQTVIKSIRSLTGYAEFYENVNLTIYKMSKDIANAYYNRDNKKVCFIGDIDGENSALNFVSIIHRETSIVGNINRQFPVSDVKEIGYSLQEDTETDGLYLLIKRDEILYDDEPIEGGESNVLLENVISLNFEFLERKSWVKKWDSRETKKYPRAVKTTLKVKNYNKIEEVFVFISMINMKR